MVKILTQDEIDAIVVVNRQKNKPPTERVVQPCDFRAAGQLSNQQSRALTALHESFARSVTNSLGAYLRVSFGMTLASIEQLAFRDFLAGAQEQGYMVPLVVRPADVIALLQVDIALVFPIIDLLLGGMGNAVPAWSGDLTEIDESIMEGVARVIARQLQATWQPMVTDIGVDRCQRPAQLHDLLAPAEKLLLLTFEVEMAGTKGAINLVVPAAFANAILRQLSTDPHKPKTHLRSFPSQGLRDRVLDCKFDTVTGIPDLRIRVRDFVTLEPGSVLKLHFSVKNPAVFAVGAYGLFEAVPARSGSFRAAHLGSSLQHSTVHGS